MGFGLSHSLFLMIYFFLCRTLETVVILMKSFINKDEILFLNPLSVSGSIHFSTYFSYLIQFTKSIYSLSLSLSLSLYIYIYIYIVMVLLVIMSVLKRIFLQ